VVVRFQHTRTFWNLLWRLLSSGC